MDPNRVREEACNNQEDDCTTAYLDFHEFIEKDFVFQFMTDDSNQFRQSLIVDVHGQSHAKGWIELGYLLTSIELDEADTLNCDSYLMKSSLRNLAISKNDSLEELVRGMLKAGLYLFGILI